MEYEGIDIEVRLLVLPQLDRERNTDDAFTTDLVSAANELRKSMAESAGLIPQLELNHRYVAVLIGLMVRLYKLYDTYVLLICEHRPEMAMILGRSACETAIDLAYLCSKKDQKEFDNFIRASLSTSKRIYNEVEADKARGVGDPNVQRRIQEAIRYHFDEAGYTLSDVQTKDWNRWGTKTFDRARECGLERVYTFIYRNLSRLTHGNWSELILYHLDKKGSLWYPRYKYSSSRPESLDGISILVSSTSEIYVETIVSDSPMKDRLTKIRQWFEIMAKKHEQFTRRPN